jgi:predicted dinucleotide-binding enzyme
MSYSIIGSGAIGSALAGQFASKGIEVLLANSRGPASLKDIVGKLGPKVQAATFKEAANEQRRAATWPIESNCLARCLRRPHL